MPALPAKSALNSAATQGAYKTAEDQLIDYLEGLLGSAGTLVGGNQTLGTAINGVVAKSGDYTTVLGDRGRVMNVDASGGARTITLLAAATAGDGHVIVVRKSDASANAVTVSGAVLRRTGDFVVCVSTGAAWVTMVSANDDMVPVEYADLTNGGANDLSTYELSHEMVLGYRYHLYVRNLSSSNASWIPTVQLRNVADTLRATSGNYRQSTEIAGNTGVNSESRGAIVPYPNVLPAANLLSFELWLDAPMVAGVKTTGRMESWQSTTAAAARVFGSFNVDVAAEAHDQITIGVTPGTMDGGDAFLWRSKEPS